MASHLIVEKTRVGFRLRLATNTALPSARHTTYSCSVFSYPDATASDTIGAPSRGTNSRPSLPAAVPLCIFHRTSTPSSPPDRSCAPSGVNCRADTACACQCSTVVSETGSQPLDSTGAGRLLCSKQCHILILPFVSPVAKRTGSVWGWKVRDVIWLSVANLVKPALVSFKSSTCSFA